VRFYCHITRKPNSVVKQVKHGLEVVSQKRICVFVDGQLDTEDPHVIEELEARPDLFWKGREDVNYRTLAYPQLVAEAERLGISSYKVGKRKLMQTLIDFERNRNCPNPPRVIAEVKVRGKVRVSKTLAEIREESRVRVETAKEEAAALADLETIEEVEVHLAKPMQESVEKVEVKPVKELTREEEIEMIEAGLELPLETK